MLYEALYDGCRTSSECRKQVHGKKGELEVSLKALERENNPLRYYLGFEPRLTGQHLLFALSKGENSDHLENEQRRC